MKINKDKLFLLMIYLGAKAIVLYVWIAAIYETMQLNYFGLIVLLSLMYFKLKGTTNVRR